MQSPLKSALAKQRSLNQETSYKDIEKESNPTLLIKPNHLKLTAKASPRVEGIVPLENALLNMNEILKDLALSAEKKVTFIDI